MQGVGDVRVEVGMVVGVLDDHAWVAPGRDADVHVGAARLGCNCA